MTSPIATGLPGGHSEWEPPDPFSNSEVKTLCADASVDFVDVKVGHCQALDFDENETPDDESRQGSFRLRRALLAPRSDTESCSVNPRLGPMR